MKKKVLYLIQYPPPIHGVTVLNKIVYNSDIVNFDVEKSIVKISYSEDMHSLQKFKIGKLYSFFSILIRFIWIIIKNRPDAVYFTIVPTGFGFLRDVFFVLVIKIFKILPIYHIHGKGIAEYSVRKIYLFLYNYVFENSKLIFSSQHLAISELKNLTFNPLKIYYLPNGVFDNLQHSSNFIKDDQINVLFFSTISESKGILVFLKAIKRLRYCHQNFCVNIAGQFFDGKIKAKVTSYISYEKMENYVNIFENVNDSLKNTLFSSANIFVHPTLNDNFPLVILEAFSYGIPVIASDEGGIPDIVEDNLNGFLVKKNDHLLLASVIERLLDNSELRMSMSNHARETFCRKYSIDKMLIGLNNILKEE